MRVAMLQADLPGSSRGGVARQVSELANALVDRGNEVVIFSLTPSPIAARYETRELSKPRVIPRGRVARFVAPPLVFARASYRGFDVVHAHGDSFLVRAAEAPIIRTFYGSAREEARHATRLHWRLTQQMLRYAEVAAVPAATMTVGISRNTAAALGGLDAIIPCGVDMRRLRPGPKSGHPTVLFVGTIRGRKRGALMLDVFRESIRPAVPGAELWFVAEQPVALPGVRSFTDVSDEVLAVLFREAWVYASASSYEGFGVPYIEAMASGTPIVTSRNTGAVELLGDNDVGVIVEDGMLGPAVVSLLRAPERRRSLGEGGRRYSSRFSWDRIAGEYELTYRDAISAWRSRLLAR
jgi:phosphatidyl-myo-inositol alpha-mannosyltransferase